MKKLLLLLLIVFTIVLSGCKEKEVPLEDIYGTYKYVKCLYVSNDSKLSANSQSYLYANKVKHRLKETTYTYLSMETNEQLFTAKDISYVKVDVDKDLSENESEILEGATTRYDLYKDGKYQGYSFVFGKDVVYFIEMRYLLKYDANIVWQIAELEKID